MCEAPEFVDIVKAHGLTGREGDVLHALESFPAPTAAELNAVAGVLSETGFKVTRAARLMKAIDLAKGMLRSAELSAARYSERQARDARSEVTPEQRKRWDAEEAAARGLGYTRFAT